jgi:hypothetical protein
MVKYRGKKLSQLKEKENISQYPIEETFVSKYLSVNKIYFIANN